MQDSAIFYVRKHIYRLLCGRGPSFWGAAEFMEIWSKKGSLINPFPVPVLRREGHFDVAIGYTY